MILQINPTISTGVSILSCHPPFRLHVCIDRHNFARSPCRWPSYLNHDHAESLSVLFMACLAHIIIPVVPETTQLVWKSSMGPPTQDQSQHPKYSSSEAHGASGLQNATPADSSHPATHERNPGPNDWPSESKPRRVPEDDARESSTEYYAKFTAPHSSSEGEVARLELEWQLSVLLAVQAERGHRIAQLTDELALKSALLEQSEANAAEAVKRAGLEPHEHADRLLMQTSLLEQRDAELVDMQARVRDLRSQFSDSQTTVQRLEGENKHITRQLNKSRDATDQHKNEAKQLKNGMEELKANHETAIAQARKQAGSL
jgi:hypothetical protein